MTRVTKELSLLRKLNPVPESDSRGWVDTPSGKRVFAEVESKLGQGGDVPPHHRRPRWRRPTITIPVFIALAASALLLASAVAGDKIIEVRAADALRDPQAVERQLATDDIDARVMVVPVKDVLVGRWFHLFVDPNAEVDEETFALLKSYVGEIDFSYDKVTARCGDGRGCARTALLEIPGSVKGPMTLVVGRSAKAGEQYWAENMEWGNELAPSGALYCMQLEDKALFQVEETLRRKGYQVEWTYDPTDTGPSGEESRRVAEPPSGTKLTVAYIFKPAIASLRVSPVQDVDEYRRIAGTPTSETGRPDFGTC